MNTLGKVRDALGGGERGSAAFVAFIFLAAVFALAVFL